MSMATVVIFNRILSCFSSDDELKTLQLEAAEFANHTLTLAEDATLFRPLGSSYIPICLIMAWVSLDDSHTLTKASIQTLLSDYQSDFPRSTTDAGILLEWIARQFDLAGRLEPINAQFPV
jgi:hypothetical protein